MYLKIGRGAGDGAYLRKGVISRVMVASRPKVNCWPQGLTRPRNYGYHLAPLPLLLLHPPCHPQSLKFVSFN
jgi:hypothetical protein